MEQVNEINDLAHSKLEQKVEQVKNNLTITFGGRQKPFDTCSHNKKGNKSSLLVKQNASLHILKHVILGCLAFLRCRQSVEVVPCDLDRVLCDRVDKDRVGSKSPPFTFLLHKSLLVVNELSVCLKLDILSSLVCRWWS